MRWYCNKCKSFHEDEELCPIIRKQLKKHPEWIDGAAKFTTVAGEESLVTTQALDRVAQEINRLAGTNLTYEGTQQFARDIQVFKRLSEEPFSRSGVFASPENAKSYFENVLKVANDNPKALDSFESKLTGYSQEVDWLRMKQGQISSVWEKSSLLSDNAPGVDGVTVNRFNGKQISRTTVKASKNPMTKNSTGITDVKKAIEKGTATEKDIIFGPKGTETAARDAGLTNPVQEKNTVEHIRKSNKRLEDKILKGQATTAPTLQQVGQKAAQGAIVGAAVSLSISAITNYVRYKNGELTRGEAFTEISQDTLKGAIVGGSLGAITIFLPGGVIGFVGGIAIGIYVGAATSNILDEIYGKGAYGEILNASGYVYGMTFNLADYYKKIEENNMHTRSNIATTKEIHKTVNRNFEEFERLKRR